MSYELTHTFTVSESQMEELKLLQKAMKKCSIEKDGSKEHAEEYYTIEKVFEFVMMLGQNHVITKQIENAAYHYDEYYEERTYPYEYGAKKYRDRMAKEKGE